MKPKTSTKPKPSAARRESDRWLEWEDALLKHCHVIETLAGLLASSGRDEELEMKLVSATGALIGEELAQVKKLASARPEKGGQP
jgi:hypothetical protein